MQFCFQILDWISCAIVVGGYNKFSKFLKTIEVLSEYPTSKQFPDLPAENYYGTMFMHNGTILLCGNEDDKQNVYQNDNGTWKEHSTLNRFRGECSIVTTPTATFIFGGGFSECYNFEYLPKDSTTWIMGKTEIPGGFTNACAIAIRSGQEIWLIGGDYQNKNQILSFNVKDHTFQELHFRLIVGRSNHQCAFIPNTNKIMLTGGLDYDDIELESTEILNIEDGSVTMASPMNTKRINHGIGVITFNGEDRLAVFGGDDGRNELDSVEVYNSKTDEWENTSIKLNEPCFALSVFTAKLSDIR